MLVLAIVFGASLLLLGAAAQRDIHRSIQRLAEQSCPSCGGVYGRDVAVRARKEYLKECERERVASPEYRIHFAYAWSVQCPECAALGEYHVEANRLMSEPTGQ